MRSFVVELVTEPIESLLLLLEGLLGRTRGLRFERSVHPLVCAVLFGMSRHDSLDADAKADPPEREARESAQAWRAERTAVVRENGPREAVLAKDPLERPAGMFVLGRGEGVAGEDVAADVGEDGQRIAVVVVAEEELTLVVDGHQVIRSGRRGARAQRVKRRRVATWPRSNEVRAIEDVADGAGCRPFDVGLDLCETNGDLAWSHMGKAATEGDDFGRSEERRVGKECR